MVNQMEGIFKKIYRRNSYTGDTVFGIETDEIDVKRNKSGYVECQGVIPFWPEDILLRVAGEWDSSGAIFNIKLANPITPTESFSKVLLKRTIQFLKERNNDFKVSNTLPKKILEITGPDIINFVKRNDSLEELIQKLKIDEWKVKELYESLVRLDSSSLIEFVTEFGGSLSDCDNLMKKYGKHALKRIKSHPYQAGNSIGMDFYVSDAMGKNRDMDPLCNERMQSIIYTAVNRLLENNGATYCIQSMLIRQIASISKKSSYSDTVIPVPLIAVKLQSMRGLKIEIVKNGVRIYRKDFYQQEQIIARHLARLSVSKDLIFKEDIEKIIKRRETESKIKYSEEQYKTYEALETTGVKIITGGPGVGKTTTINELIHSYIEAFPKNKIALAAPTGRAAQRMWDVTKIEAKTIHKTIDYQPYERSDEPTIYNSENPIDADCIVIDEMSMVDTATFSLLLPAIKTGSLIILLGDVNQLQSVAPGNILNDLIKSQYFKVYQLTKVYRQIGSNSIIENAYKILDGDMNFTKDDKFMIESASDDKEAITKLVDSFNNWCKEGGLQSLQVLTPIKGSGCGAFEINKKIAKIIEAGTTEEECKTNKTFYYGRVNYRIGDKVIFHKNNYNDGYCNGDIGYVSGIIKDGIEIDVSGETKKIVGESLKDLSLAYAITMHKSQGSEFDDVIIVLPDTYKNMLTKNLLFTAVTRAKKRVKIIYISSALSDSVHTITVDKRYTGLVDKIRKEMT